MILSGVINRWHEMAPRERDAWVQKTVFGGEIFGEFRTVTGVRVLIPHYTTDISAAWAVVEEMRKDHFIHLTDATPYGWSVDLCPAGETIMTMDINADTAPEAIGLASIISKLSLGESAV